MDVEEANLNFFLSILQNYNVLQIVQKSRTYGWDEVWKEFDGVYNTGSFNNEREKNVFVDLFCNQCLKLVFAPEDGPILWDIIKRWFNYRKLDNRMGALHDEEKVALIHFCLTMRAKLEEYLTRATVAELASLIEEHQQTMVSVWRQHILEPFSALNLYWPSSQVPAELKNNCKSLSYKDLMIASMYQPFDADEYDISAADLIASELPLYCKTVLIAWMVNTPYFHGCEKHRKKLIRYVPEICRALVNHPKTMSPAFFLTVVQEIMTGFWRASYIGGNNVDALSAFGDFIHTIMTRFIPCRHVQKIPRVPGKGEKIRIGYISRNFYKQAVSCYMVNRIIYHDRDKFEVYVFALGDYHDEISELFKQNSHYFQRIEKMTDIRGIVESILSKELDILIYTDIGMDPITYALSGLQLAPVQCALVGHGTTTGMPTIQYYISGDFEGPEAEMQYRERLIRLPNLGAAQYLPVAIETKITRQELGIPDDAVVFISCANGIKHGEARDRLFVELLKRAPNAWIILKPFATHAGIDRKYSHRFKEAAKQAGVDDRLLILPPLGLTKHVLGLLSIADVQLDTYPYGGWTTNMEALYAGLPVVTQEGYLSRSRWGAGMLRALGISEGIAANEEEYVNWAVKFAQDEELRLRVRTIILARARDVLFNGPAAQPAYEKALEEIYKEYCQTIAASENNESVAHDLQVTSQEVVTIATSLNLKDLDIQKRAVHSWCNAGFKVVSLNTIEEIALLRPQCPDIEFIAVLRDGRDKYGIQSVYFDDILAYFRNRKCRLCGIITPDLHLQAENLHFFIRKHAVDSFIFGSRVDVESPQSSTGQVYAGGFDYFFFDRKILPYYTKQDFCLGLPWLDYWAVLVPLMHKQNVKKLTSTVALHISHPVNYDQNIWIQLGLALGQNFHPPFALLPETMPRFASEILAIINALSHEIVI